MQHHRGTGISRTVAAITTAVLVFASIAGCTNDKKASANLMNAIADDIQTTLAARPDVTKVDVVYQDTFTAPGAVDVSITAKPGADLEPVLDESLKLVWTSKLDPLKSIRVGVADPQDPSRGITKSVALLNPDDKAAMRTKYGPRPK